MLFALCRFLLGEMPTDAQFDMWYCKSSSIFSPAWYICDSSIAKAASSSDIVGIITACLQISCIHVGFSWEGDVEMWCLLKVSCPCVGDLWYALIELFHAFKRYLVVVISQFSLQVDLGKESRLSGLKYSTASRCFPSLSLRAWRLRKQCITDFNSLVIR